MNHYTHPDIAVPKRRVIVRIGIACLLWCAVFVYAIYGD